MLASSGSASSPACSIARGHSYHNVLLVLRLGRAELGDMRTILNFRSCRTEMAWKKSRSPEISTIVDSGLSIACANISTERGGHGLSRLMIMLKLRYIPKIFLSATSFLPSWSQSSKETPHLCNFKSVSVDRADVKSDTCRYARNEVISPCSCAS